MKRIRAHKLSWESGIQELFIPEHAEILDVGLVNLDLILWSYGEIGAKSNKRFFTVLCGKENIHDEVSMKHIRSVVSPQGGVLHVFEVSQ